MNIWLSRPGWTSKQKSCQGGRAKTSARRTLFKKWKPQVIAMSGVTDCYQPVERKLKLTRGCLEVLAEFRNPVIIITKNFLVTRDIDVLAELAKHQAVGVFVSLNDARCRGPSGDGAAHFPARRSTGSD